MLHWPWRAMFLGAVVTILIYSAVRPDPESRDLSEATVEHLISQLGSSRESIQRMAASCLVDRGDAAIQPLIASLETADADLIQQIFQVLEDMYLSSDAKVADAVEDAIEELVDHPEAEISRAAEELNNNNHNRRVLRAYAKIESSGGVFVNSQASGSGRGRRMSSEIYLPDLVIIGSQWVGGQESLKYLRWMQGARNVHIATDAPLSELEIQSLIENPSLNVRREHEGCLGVRISMLDPPLSIRDVTPESPADYAGLQSHDQILTVNGQPLQNYGHFQQLLRSVPAGDEVQLQIRRSQKTETVTIRLGSMFGTELCRCLEEEDIPADAESAINQAEDASLDQSTDNSVRPSRNGSPRFRDFFRPRELPPLSPSR